MDKRLTLAARAAVALGTWMLTMFCFGGCQLALLSVVPTGTDGQPWPWARVICAGTVLLAGTSAAVWSGARVAPSHKIGTALLIGGLWGITSLAILVNMDSGYLHGGDISSWEQLPAVVFSFLGAMLGVWCFAGRKRRGTGHRGLR